MKLIIKITWPHKIIFMIEELKNHICSKIYLNHICNVTGYILKIHYYYLGGLIKRICTKLLYFGNFILIVDHVSNEILKIVK